MSMMGYFREIPTDVLRRLHADASLARDVVVAGDRPSPVPPSRRDEAIALWKASMAESGDRVLALLPAEQREKVEALPPEKQKAWLRLFADQLAKQVGWDRLADRGAPTARVSPEDLGPRLKINKTWQGLHFLLTGTAWETTSPLGQAILGGTEMGADGGYGPPRLLLPEEVAAVSAALDPLSREALAGRYDATALEAADIYPGRWDDQGKTWLLDAFEEVKSFYASAAARGAAVLLYLR